MVTYIVARLLHGAVAVILIQVPLEAGLALEARGDGVLALDKIVVRAIQVDGVVDWARSAIERRGTALHTVAKIALPKHLCDVSFVQ